MEYTVDEIRQFTAEEDVKFLRLALLRYFRQPEKYIYSAG